MMNFAVGRALAETVIVTALRACAWRYWVAAFLVVLAAAGCRRGVPVVDVGPKPPVALGTITGIVRGPEGTSAVVGRSVEVVNVATGEKQSVKRPGIVDLGRGDIDSHIEFVVASVRLTRPHGPGYRMNNGLGSPIA
jgi:hypothetical protein